MGLDTVEIILQCEETFGIDLPDSQCASVLTVGGLYRLILAKLELPYQPAHQIELHALGSNRFGKSLPQIQPWTTPDVWRTLKTLIQDQLQLDLEEIKDETRFLDDLGCD